MNTNYSIEQQIRTGMNIVDRDEFTETIKAVSHIAATTVQRTLGPYAHTTIIDDGSHTYPTKDGWAILQRIRFQDPMMQSIYTMLKNISARIVDKVGDGTTTAMVVADHFIEAVDNNAEHLMSTYRQRDIINALNDIRDRIIQDLEENAIHIEVAVGDEDRDYQEIFDIANVASNGNTHLATIMQKIYKQTGNPNVLVDMDGGKECSFEIMEGYRLDCNFIMSERYANTSEGYYRSLDDHELVVFDHNVTYTRHAEMIDFMIRQANQRGHAIILMAPYFDDVISSSFTIQVQQCLQKNPQAIPGLFIVQVPEMSTTVTRNSVNDFTVLAGVSMVSSTKVNIFNEIRHNDRVENEEDKIHSKERNMEGYNFTTAQELLDSCYTVVSDFTIGKKFFTIHNPKRNTVLYQQIFRQATDDYNRAVEEAANSPTNLTKALVDASYRLNKLSGALGVIHVGGVTDLERSCMKDVVDDTFLACKSAFENGVISGMNLGAMASIRRVRERCDKDLKELPNYYSKLCCVIAEMLYDAYRATTVDIFRNKLHGDSDDWVFYNAKYYADNTLAEPDETDQITVVEWIEQLVATVMETPTASYDIVDDILWHNGKTPHICNSVATDVEILNAIISILGMVLTSDQYLSINRQYDKVAAMKQQRAMNAEDRAERINDLLRIFDDYLGKSANLQHLVYNATLGKAFNELPIRADAQKPQTAYQGEDPFAY